MRDVNKRSLVTSKDGGQDDTNDLAAINFQIFSVKTNIHDKSLGMYRNNININSAFALLITNFTPLKVRIFGRKPDHFENCFCTEIILRNSTLHIGSKGFLFSVSQSRSG